MITKTEELLLTALLLTIIVLGWSIFLLTLEVEHQKQKLARVLADQKYKSWIGLAGVVIGIGAIVLAKTGRIRNQKKGNRA